MEKIRLLIASDDTSSSRGLNSIFASESMYSVLGNFSLAEAVEKSILLQPDVVLIDVPEDLTFFGSRISQIKSECPCSLILALVGSDAGQRLPELLSHGVDGCVPKGIIRGCLMRIVELACWSGVFCLPGPLKKTVFSGKTEVRNSLQQKNAVPGSGEFLTSRESEILQLMAKNRSNREIARELFISEPTVKTHVSNILRKLGQNNRTQAILYSYKNGLVNEPMAAHK